MNAKTLYTKMETDFRLAACRDDWSEMDFNEFITPEYKSRHMGLMTDNAEEITHAYTAVFPSPAALQKIYADGRQNALLFLHHPMQWQMPELPVFRSIPEEDLQRLKNQKISLYNLHTPLDANGEFSTTVTFAKTLGINISEEFFEYNGIKAGIIGWTEHHTPKEMKNHLESVLGHEAKLYNYGDNMIKDNKVALVAGGGNDETAYKYLKKQKINLYITGITNMETGYKPAIAAHRTAQKAKINILTGTHYSTEKFACIKMTEYFQALGISSEFIQDTPNKSDQ